MIGAADRRSMAVVLGSSRSDGNTRKAVNLVFGDPPVGVVDLSRLDIRAWDYTRRNRGDDVTLHDQPMPPRSVEIFLRRRRHLPEFRDRLAVLGDQDRFARARDLVHQRETLRLEPCRTSSR